MRKGRPLLDFHAFPLRVMETPDKPQEAVLKVGFSDGIYGRSKGGLTFSGWTCEHLPYLVELDNYGVSRHPGEPNAKGEFNWVWGYRRNLVVCQPKQILSQQLAALRLELGASNRYERLSGNAGQPDGDLAIKPETMVFRE